jgi:hypothetical protein
MTRYLDGFTGYSYNNTLSLAKSWEKMTVAFSYENGGFTDNGEVNMWYVDRYRRLMFLSANYAF